MRMVWNQVCSDPVCTLSDIPNMRDGWSAIDEPDLFWTAKEVFRYPVQEQVTANKQVLIELLDWAVAKGVAAAEELRLELQMDSLDLTELEVDFTALFVNGFPTAKAHPFAGWYNGDKIIFGDSHQEMLHFYTRLGITLDLDQSIPADHIMVALEFIASMVENYVHTGSQLFLQALKEIVNLHLQNWIFDFLGAMEKQAHSSFYRNIASILSVLFKELKEDLKGVA